MSIHSRLTQVRAAAKEVPFDDSAKFIVFSDCHRGDNSWADDFAGNQSLFFFALEHYFRQGFTYVELGDGDELFENRRFADVRQAHSHIFWLMREFYRAGRLYLIHGNHDIERRDARVVADTLYHYHDERTGKQEPLFDGITVHEGLVLKHTPTKGTIFLVHGYQGDLINDRCWRIGRFMVRHVWRHLQLLGVKDSTSPARNVKKREGVERETEAWVREKNQPTIFGHTHRPSFPEEGRPPYFNDGSCIHPRCITGIEIEDGETRLIKWWLKPDDAGRLRVARELVAGPRTISSLFGAPAVTSPSRP
jgi:UDP-2,3-diacylglucosamine pyrophosphatase LpxH